MSPRDPIHTPWAFSLTDASQLPLTGELHPLKREFARWLTWGNLATLLVGIGLFVAWYLYSHRSVAEPPPREIKIVRYTDLGVPPSIAQPTAPQLNIAKAVAEAAAPPSIGIPEPVADDLARAPTIATVAEMAEALAPITVDDLNTGGGESLVIELDVETAPEPDEFVAVEEEPMRISIDPPVYPDMAMSAGVEGTVLVRVLVGKDGKVKDAILIEGHELLQEAALACARTAIFRPALAQHRPVEVWVMMPVTFKLN